MIRSMIVAVDGSEAASRAVDLAGELASRCGCALTVLHVQVDSDAEALAQAQDSLAQHEHSVVGEAEMARTIGQQVLARAEARARRAGADAVETVLLDGDPVEAILEAARARGADLVVLGRRGLGSLAGVLLGSVSQRVAQHARCACLTVA
jgi:nucleotide-binding universal stress UspA family protein